VPKRLPCSYFYDSEGSRLFELICGLPEYYLTRTERDILQQCAGEIAGSMPGCHTLVELGSGTAEKTRLLLDAYLSRHGRVRYVPIDISRSTLELSSRRLLAEYAALEIVALAGDYEQGLQLIAAESQNPKLVLWLGSNIGNFDRPAAVSFLRDLRDRITGHDRLLIGIDLRKDRRILEMAYDDSSGITARFNLNLLARINRELGGHFDLNAFHHRAVYDEDQGRIEMYLVSRRSQQIAIERLGIEVAFEAGEAIHTENSYKYSLAEIDALATRAGLVMERRWLDRRELFSLNLLRPQS
jgi:dimethylhistidine N-methyltransferase